MSRTGYRYQSKARKDDVLRQRLKELAAKQVAYGYLFLHKLLKNEGLVVNKKRTYRIHTEEGLQVRTKKRKKLQLPRQPMIVPVERDQGWSMDFVSDQLSNGRRFRVLNLIDDYSREVINQLVSFSISGQQVARFWVKLLSLEVSPQRLSVTTAPSLRAKQCSFGARLPG